MSRSFGLRPKLASFCCVVFASTAHAQGHDSSREEVDGWLLRDVPKVEVLHEWLGARWRTFLTVNVSRGNQKIHFDLGGVPPEGALGSRSMKWGREHDLYTSVLTEKVEGDVLTCSSMDGSANLQLLTGPKLPPRYKLTFDIEYECTDDKIVNGELVTKVLAHRRARGEVTFSAGVVCRETIKSKPEFDSSRDELSLSLMPTYCKEGAGLAPIQP